MYAYAIQNKAEISAELTLPEFNIDQHKFFDDVKIKLAGIIEEVRESSIEINVRKILARGIYRELIQIDMQSVTYLFPQQDYRDSTQ